MTNKEIYREFCHCNPNLPIFITDWWVDAVCAGKQCDVLLHFNANGEIQAALIYLLRKRAWMKYIIMPQLTQMGGIWISDTLTNEKIIVDICQQFSQQLENLGLSYYYQHYPINSPAVAAMQALGFKTNLRITYRIEDLSNLDNVIQRFSKNKKRQLHKAQSLRVKMDMSVEEFYRFHTKCLQKQRKQISYTREFLLVLERKAHRIDQSQIIAICDKNDNVLAAAFVVWDHQSLYYLIPCYDPDYKTHGASALLVLEAIKLAQQKGVIFDFEGSMIKGVADHYKQFGSTATSYYSVEKYYKWYFWLANAYNMLRERMTP